MYSKICREGSLLPLVVPLLDPGVWADSAEVLIEELTGLILLALNTTTNYIAVTSCNP